MQVSENNRLLPCRFLPVASDWVRARMPGKPCNGIHAFLNTGIRTAPSPAAWPNS